MSFESQAVRDLKWTVSSPSLLEPSVSGQVDFDVDPEHLTAFLAERRTHRVGAYFENLVEFWLRHVRRVEIVERGFQIHDGDRTVGELDFIFRDEAGVLTHWETAVKFYLHHEGTKFIGPNAGDTLDRKLQRLFEHQLPLSRRAWPEVEPREAFVKGRLFYHCGEEPSELPARISRNHLRGVWIHASELDWFDTQPEDRTYDILDKPHWLTVPINSERLSLAELKQRLAAHFAASNRALHLAAGNGTHIFVVHDHWPVRRT